MPDLSSFIYSRQQKKLVGNDALKKFKKVFGYDSRVIVILYRANWGKTPFTFAEEEAIRDRKFREMFEEFMIIVIRRTVWYNLNEFSFNS